MNFLRKLYLKLTDPVLKTCLWHRLYLANNKPVTLPTWFHRLSYCDCQQKIYHYQSHEPDYTNYLITHSFLSCIQKRQRQRQIKHWSYQPLISIQIAVYQVETGLLQACLDSISRQLYPHWQLCLVDDGSQSESIQQCLLDFKHQFPDKVKLLIREENLGITTSSQQAFELTEGEFIALMDHDDYLAPEALFEVVNQLNHQPDLDWLYSDNDKLDSRGQRCCLHSKPAWSPELLLSYNYVLHLSVIRRSLLQQSSGFRPGFEGSQDHDLFLRLAEQTSRVCHIPRILYSWRQSNNSVALNPANKAYAYESALKALNSALKRRNQSGHAIHPKHSWLGSYQIIRTLPKINYDLIILGEDEPEESLSAQTQAALINSTTIKANQPISEQIQTFLQKTQAPYLLFLSPHLKFLSENQIYQLASGLEPDQVALSSAKIVNQNHQVDHCGLSYDHGQILYPLRNWPEDMAGMGAFGALPRNSSVHSPWIALAKRDLISPYLYAGESMQCFNSWFLALDLALIKAGLRISIDGGIALLNRSQENLDWSITDKDKDVLKKQFPLFFSEKDGWHSRHMNE